MNPNQYREKQQQDPEYIAAELDLADRVLDLRLEKGWSQAELAKRADVDAKMLTKVESGIGNPTVYTLWRLARALGARLSIEFVKEEHDNEQTPTRL